MMYSPQDKKEMNIRQMKVDIGQGQGNTLTNAVHIALFMMNRDKKSLTTREDIEKEIDYWWDKLYGKSSERVEVEHKLWKDSAYPDPQTPPPMPTKKIENMEAGEKWQKHYNKISEEDEVNAQLQEASEELK